MRTLSVIVLSLASGATLLSATLSSPVDHAPFLNAGKEHHKWILLASAATPRSAAPFSMAARAEFLKSGKEHHKWVKGMPLPESLEDAGLLDDAELVWTGMALDGGTRGFLLKDSVGNYLAFCTGPGFQSKDHPRRIDAPVGSRLLIGALHYTHEEAQLVETGSKCEEFLKGLMPLKVNIASDEITNDPANANGLAARALPLVEMATKKAPVP